MARRKEVDLLADCLKGQSNHQASAQKASSLLGWDLEKVQRVARRGNDDPAMPVFVGKRGVIKYRGSEIGASVGLYSDLMRIIRQYWGPRDPKLRNIDVIETAHAGQRGAGAWTHPDLVVAADPLRRQTTDEPRRLHAIEVKTASSFDLRVVYQAHAEGRGANYAWAFGSKTPALGAAEWERILWTASALGVGIVTFDRPHSYGTWTTHLPAARMQPAAEERERFIGQVVGVRARESLGL